MPTLRKLQENEVQALEHKGIGTRAVIALQYDGYLADFEPNDYGEALLDEHENRLTVRNRLKAAARRRGWTLRFFRSSNPIRFKVISEGGDQAIEDSDQAYQEDEGELEAIAVAA